MGACMHEARVKTGNVLSLISVIGQLSSIRYLSALHKGTVSLQYPYLFYMFLCVMERSSLLDPENWFWQLWSRYWNYHTWRGEMKKYELINIIIMATKMIIYLKWYSTSKIHLKMVKLVMKDIFQIEKYWAETNVELAISVGVWNPIYVETTRIVAGT